MKRKKFKGLILDELTKVSVNSKKFHKHKEEDGASWTQTLIPGWLQSDLRADLNPWSFYGFLLVVILIFSGIFIRLFHLQVVKGVQNRELADSNRIMIKVIHAPRGIVTDRNGRILARNEPGFRLIRIEQNQEKKVRLVTRDEALKMEIKSDPDLGNLDIDSIRTYPYGEQTSHVLGYMGEITDLELKDSKFKNYKVGDQVGRGGVEEFYEKILKGVDGGEIIEVDSTGKKLRILKVIPPIPGSNLKLTIDADLQQITFNALLQGIEKAKSCCGAAIATDPVTGEVLSLVSIPSFNPLDLSYALVDQNSPLLNRVISGTYPPGSTFKIVSAMAGLSSGKVTSATQFEDTGVINLGPYSFANWYFTEYGKKEGIVDIKKALQRSNDIYFYHLGALTGEDTLARVAHELSLGKKIGIDIPEEASGVIADSNWKMKVLGTIWYPGDTLHTAIGQGFSLVTPLQIQNLISSFANDGRESLPHLALNITSPEGLVIKGYNFDRKQITKFKAEHFKLIKDALSLVPKPGGTAWPFFGFKIPSAGKTGTAEFGSAQGKTHAWYTSFAPVDNPKIGLTVLVEAGGEGSTVAAPIAKEVYRWYFSPDKNKLIQDVYTQATDSGKNLGE